MSARRHRLAVGVGLAAAALLALLATLWLGVPAAVRWGIETVAAGEIGRPMTVGDVRFNPFTLRLEVRDLAIGGTSGDSSPLLTLGELQAQIGASSIWRFAPVIRSLRLQTLRANITRLAPNRFGFSDIVDRLMARTRTGEPARFAVNNIELVDGEIALDDRFVAKRHAITEISVGIPFISSLADREEIHVKPSTPARSRPRSTSATSS